MEEQFDLRPLLDYIDPSMLNYSEWAQVGMALKHEGYSVNDWDKWSQQDSARYHSGECAKKWNSFNEDTSQIVTGATITQMAKEGGWHSAHDDDEMLDWNSSLQTDDLDRGYRLIDKDYIKGTKIQRPDVWSPVDQVKRFVSTLFEPDEIVSYVTQAFPHQEKNGKTKWVPGGSGVYTQTAGQLLDALDRANGDISNVFGDPNTEAGAWMRINPMDGEGVKNRNVANFKYALVESDSLTLEQQNELFRRLELPIATLTYSAGKSLHALVKIDADSYHEYQARVKHLYTILEKNGVHIDSQDKNPSRLSRLPGFERNGDKQFLIDTNIGQPDWDSWETYIEDLNDNLPDIENLSSLFDKPIQLAPELIHGVLRLGHKMLFAAPSKAGKSFGLMQLAIAIAEGQKWNGFQCEQGRVLYVNLEIDPNSAKKRLVDIYKALKLDHNNVDKIDMWNLRGKTAPMDKLTPKLIRRAQDGHYSAIIIDPIYKVLTGDENSASDMAKFVNQFDKIATELGASIIYAHHFSKGAQGGKSSMERSSGSGVFSRDPDSILTATPLPVDDDLRDAHIVDEESLYLKKQIAKYNPDYQVPVKDIGEPEKMDQHLLQAFAKLPNAQQTLQEISKGRMKVAQQAALHTAWRLEGTLREFPSFAPISYWFKYPIYEVDHQLDDVKFEVAGDNEMWKKRMQDANQNRSNKAQKDLEEAFNILNTDNGFGVQAVQIAEYLGVKRTTVYNRVRKSDNFEIVDGMVTKKK